MSMNKQRGFNLVEVLIALAILGSVLLGVVTLFFLGRGNVYSGKQMSRAVSVMNKVTEDFSTMTRDQIYGAFALSTEGLTTATVGGRSYTNCVIRDTSMAGTAKDPQNFLTRWKALIGPSVFTQVGNLPRITLILMPREATVAPNAESASPATTTDPTSQVLQIRAVLEWQEELKSRTLVVDTVKTIRRRIPVAP